MVAAAAGGLAGAAGPLGVFLPAGGLAPAPTAAVAVPLPAADATGLPGAAGGSAPPDGFAGTAAEPSRVPAAVSVGAAGAASGSALAKVTASSWKKGLAAAWSVGCSK